MQASDVMTTRVVSLTPEMMVQAAAKLMLEERISGMPVLDAQGKMVGMLSEGDLIHRAEIGTAGGHRHSWWLDLFSGTSDATQYVKSHARTVGDVMSTDVISVQETTLLSEIANVLETRRIKRVPVVRDGMLVGVVSRANLVQALASQPERPVLASVVSDTEILSQLLNEMKGHNWAFPERNIVVTDGVVHLWGYRPDEQVQAMRVAAEGVSGVKGVRDHTEPYPAPAIGM
jgi:CBS domain-containing protein